MSTLYAYGECPTSLVPVPGSAELKDSQPTLEDHAQPERPSGADQVAVGVGVGVGLPLGDGVGVCALAKMGPIANTEANKAPARRYFFMTLFYPEIAWMTIRTYVDSFREQATSRRSTAFYQESAYRPRSLRSAMRKTWFLDAFREEPDF